MGRSEKVKVEIGGAAVVLMDKRINWVKEEGEKLSLHLSFAEERLRVNGICCMARCVLHDESS